MANFIDRNVQFPHRFKLTKVGSSEAPITVDITREQGDGSLEAPYTEGSKLNAANINAAFDAKQDKLVAGYGLILDGNVLSIKTGLFTDYEHIAQKLEGNSDADNAKWIKYPDSELFGKGKHYFNTVENAAVRYTSASVEFTAEDVICDSSTDYDPTVAVCFVDSADITRNIFCTFGFLQNRVRVIEASPWRILAQANDIYFTKVDGKPKPFTVRVVRSKNGGGNYVYRLFVNGMLALTFNGTTNTDYNSIRIGTIGCRATLRNWKVNGAY